MLIGTDYKADPGDLNRLLDRRQGQGWKERLWRLLAPPKLLIPNPAELDAQRRLGVAPGPWNLYIGGAGSAVSGFLNVDLFAEPGVDVQADAAQLPFPDALFTQIECDAVLEHVPDPARILAELHRVAAPGAWLRVVVPFCHPYHPYPEDYRRFTIQGVEAMAQGWTLRDSGWRTGPTATLLVFLVEWAKLWFRSQTVRALVHCVLGWILWPLRYADLYFFRTGRAGRLGNHCYVWFQK